MKTPCGTYPRAEGEQSRKDRLGRGSDLVGEGIVDHIEWQRNLLVSLVLSPWGNGKQASSVQAAAVVSVPWVEDTQCGRLAHRSLPGRPHCQEDHRG